jgi:hypothetical protein
LGDATGCRLAANLRRRYPKLLLYFVVLLFFFHNQQNLLANQSIQYFNAVFHSSSVSSTDDLQQQ